MDTGRRAQIHNSLNWFSALQCTNTRASRTLVARYSAPMLSTPLNYDTPMEASTRCLPRKSKHMVNTNTHVQEPNNPAMERLRIIIWLLPAVLITQLLPWFSAAWSKIKECSALGRYEHNMSNHWTNALAISSRQSAPPTLCAFLP